MTISLVQVRAYGRAYRAQIGSGAKAIAEVSPISARAAARDAFAKRIGLDPYKRGTLRDIKVSHVVTSAASGAELFLCELVDDPTSERSAA